LYFSQGKCLNINYAANDYNHSIRKRPKYIVIKSYWQEHQLEKWDGEEMTEKQQN